MAERRLSVVHVTEPVDGGVGHHVLDLARDQVQRGWRVAVVSPPSPAFVAEVAAAGAEHLAWTLPVRHATEREARRPSTGALRGIPALAELVRGRNPSLVHLHAAQAGLLGRLALRGSRPTVFQPNAWSFFAVEGLTRRAAVGWERLGARWTAAAICVSEQERTLAERARIRSRFAVIPNGVDLEAIAYAGERERAEARARLGLADRPVVVGAGALRRQKGYDVLLAAWPRVLERVPDAELVLVGDGPQRQALERVAAEAVRFAGERRDVLDWLAAADVVALPSRWEGMSFVLLEAMARGRSVVATDVAGAAEAIGSAGAVVPVEAPEPLAARIAERLLDRALAEREGREARLRVERRHDVQHARAATAELYVDVLARAGA